MLFVVQMTQNKDYLVLSFIKLLIKQVIPTFMGHLGDIIFLNPSLKTGVKLTYFGTFWGTLN